MMDVAVPANMKIGLAQDAVAQRGWAILAADALELPDDPDAVLVDLREASERERHGAIPGALHAPYPGLRDNLRSGGLLRGLASRRRLVFYCAYGERSAMAVQAAQDAGIGSARHIQGGISAWKAAGGPMES
jgi:rhodanese-related sulfurtransferase